MLLDRIRPRPGPKSTPVIWIEYVEEKDKGVERLLYEWCDAMLEADEHDPWAIAILPDVAVDRLSHFERYPLTRKAVGGYLAQRWMFWATYRDELMTLVLAYFSTLAGHRTFLKPLVASGWPC
jgi:hypothetical protein